MRQQVITKNNFIRWRRLWIALTIGVSASFACAEIPLAQVHTVATLSEGLALPSDVAIGPNGHVYVVDSGNHRVAVFERNGKRITTFASKGNGAGQLRDPVGIGIDHSGQVYVADKGNNRIQIFTADGKFVRSLAVKDVGKDIAPIDVAIDASGKTIYVTGNTNHKVMAFSPAGKLLSQWGGEGFMRGEFRYPATITIGKDGRVYVVDVLNTRVQARDARGQIFLISEWGVLPGQLFRPKGVALDHKGRVYVSDSYMDIVQVFNTDYSFAHVLGAGDKPHAFTSAAGMAIDNDNRLYVAEMLKNRVSVIELPP